MEHEPSTIEETEIKESFSAGGVVVNKSGKVLVVNQQGVSWSLPKGHIDPGEGKLEAAKREILEETGISDLNLVQELGEVRRPKMIKEGLEDPLEIKTVSYFLFTADQEELEPQDSDNPEALWLSVDEAIAKLSHPRDKEFLVQLKEKIASL